MNKIINKKEAELQRNISIYSWKKKCHFNR